MSDQFGRPPAYQPPNPEAGQQGVPGQYPGGAPAPGYPPTPGGYPPIPGDYPSTSGGYPSTPGGAPVHAAKKSRRGLWIGLSIVAVILIAGGAILVALVLRTVNEATNSKLSTPQTVAGLTLSTEPQLQSAADQMNSELRKDIQNSTGAVGAFYSDPSDESKIVMIAGVTGLVANPGKELDDAFSGMSQAGMTATNIHTVDPGPLGGEAKCGEGTTSGVSVAVCSWADRGSLGLMVFFNRDVASSEALFRQIRGEILTRG